MEHQDADEPNLRKVNDYSLEFITNKEVAEEIPNSIFVENLMVAKRYIEHKWSHVVEHEDKFFTDIYFGEGLVAYVGQRERLAPFKSVHEDIREGAITIHYLKLMSNTMTDLVAMSTRLELPFDHDKVRTR